MQIKKYKISVHAARRMAQRNLNVGDVALVMRFGRKIHRARAMFFFLGERDVPEGLEKKLEKLIGATIVVTDKTILTVYRNRNALTNIKHKLKRYISKKRFVAFDADQAERMMNYA